MTIAQATPQVPSRTRALLLAGGEGTRLRPLTLTTPKCLVPINGKPLLGLWLDMLFKGGVERALVNTSYLPDLVRAFCDASPWRSRIDLVHEPSLLGTAGTLRANREYLSAGAPFFMAHADNLSHFSVGEFFAAHASRPSSCIGTMMTFTAERPQDCGIVELNPEGIAIAIHEKVANPPGNLANAAVFVLENEVFEALKRYPLATDFCRDIVPPLAGRWFTFHNGIYHRDIGTPSSLALAQRDFQWT